MYPINLEGSFESSKLEVRRTDRLSDVVRATEKDLRARFRAADIHDRNMASRLILDFCGIYFSLDERLGQIGAIPEQGKEKLRLSKIYSLYVASVATLNKLYDSNIEAVLQAQDGAKYSHLITEKDFAGISDYALLGKSLEKIKSLPKGRTPQSEKYHLYVFFDSLRAYALSEVFSSPDTRQSVGKLSVTLKDMDFRDLSAKRRKKNGNGKQKTSTSGEKETKEQLEKLPETVPAYTAIYPEAKLDEVVGNIDGLIMLLTSIHQAADYDPIRKTNPWAGLGYHELVLIHGVQGTGKNFTVDAALNAGKQISKKCGVEIEYISFKKELRSIYKDRVPQLLAHFVDLELKSNKVYVNLINEADGLFGVGKDGLSATEANKLISDAKEVMDLTMGKGIVWWLLSNNPSAFEAAMGDRLISGVMEGAVTPEEYGKLFEIKLRKAKEARKYALGPAELDQAVDYFMQRKREVMDNHGIIVSGRAVAYICEKFTAFDKRTYLQNAYAVHGVPSDAKRKKIYELMPEVTYKRLVHGIDSVINELVRRKLTNNAYAKQHQR